jgi:hypothetical protein
MLEAAEDNNMIVEAEEAVGVPYNTLAVGLEVAVAAVEVDAAYKPQA